MTAIARRGFVYVRDAQQPEVIGRTEAMDVIRQAHSGRLPAEYSFDVIRRCYWRWEPAIPAPPPAHENEELTAALIEMARRAAYNYGGKHHGNKG